ncbi:hypothetical protein MC885_012400 [Smutsia gigantea]|nr:hypothetical protein MC885_012400 [Smutsia gigantea]
MMLSQIASKQAENGERAGSPDVLRCSSQGHRKDSDKSRSRKDDDSLAEASHSKKTVKKAEGLNSKGCRRRQHQVVVVEQNGSFQVKSPKNFICEHCFGAFRSSYHLKRHILIHTVFFSDRSITQTQTDVPRVPVQDFRRAVFSIGARGPGWWE